MSIARTFGSPICPPLDGSQRPWRCYILPCRRLPLAHCVHTPSLLQSLQSFIWVFFFSFLKENREGEKIVWVERERPKKKVKEKQTKNVEREIPFFLYIEIETYCGNSLRIYWNCYQSSCFNLFIGLDKPFFLFSFKRC